MCVFILILQDLKISIIKNDLLYGVFCFLPYHNILHFIRSKSTSMPKKITIIRRRRRLCLYDWTLYIPLFKTQLKTIKQKKTELQFLTLF